MHARPRINENEKLTRQFTFYCTDEERAEIKTLARIHGYKSASEYIRRVALGYESANRDELKQENE